RDVHGAGHADARAPDARTSRRRAWELDADMDLAVQPAGERDARDERRGRPDEERVRRHDLGVRADPPPCVVALVLHVMRCRRGSLERADPAERTTEVRIAQALLRDARLARGAHRERRSELLDVARHTPTLPHLAFARCRYPQ